jgi:hypothetical protein
LIEPAAVHRLLTDAAVALGTDVVLTLRVFVPAIDKGIRYDTDRLNHIVLFDSSEKAGRAPTLVYDNTTTLLELRINRLNDYVTVGTAPRKH